MRHRWPADTQFTRMVLDVEEKICGVCGRNLHVCDHRQHRIFTLQGPLELVCKLAHCSDRNCAVHSKTISPYAETTLTLPWWLIGWDVFCWMGQRRFARHWAVPQIRAELADSYQICLSADAIEDSLRRYQTMLAARQQDPQVLAAAYQNVAGLVLSIDGLQPEKGHETLYVVRDLRAKRIWFAEALLSSTVEEVRRLLQRARDWANRLGLPVQLWLSDKQDAFVQGIAAEFPGVPHRYCANHFLRDLAKPMLDADSHAKVRMRSKVRGLRTIERAVLEQRRSDAAAPSALSVPNAATAAQPPTNAEPSAAPPPADASDVVLDYCSAVRGIVNDDQGGPLQPPGLRMAEALEEVRASLQRNLDCQAARTGARPTATVNRLHRPGFGCGPSRTRKRPTASARGPACRCHVGSYQRFGRPAAGGIRAFTRGIRRPENTVLPAPGCGDGQFPNGSVRGRRNVGIAPGQFGLGALVSPA
jgi:hypothetical protein